MPEISVIVPVYNVETYLGACVESILAQSYTNFELLLVDDGSQDGSGALCDQYAARDSRIRVIHQDNQGQAAARNHALTLASGRWICFVDSDDLVHPRLLERLYEGAGQNGNGMAMCGYWEGELPPAMFWKAEQKSFASIPMEESELTCLLDAERYPGWVIWGKLIPKTDIEAYPFTPGRIYEDNEAVCRWLVSAGKLAYTEEKLYFYRTNPASTTQKQFSLKRLDYLWALESIIRFYHGLGWETLAERFCDRYAEAAAGFYIRSQDELHAPQAARKIRRDARRLFGPGGVPVTKKQFETMFDAMHPRLIRLYWPLEACVRTLREQGVRGLFRAIARQGRKQP